MDDGAKTYVLGDGEVEAARPLPRGWSIFAAVSVSPEFALKLARTIVDWPTRMVGESAEIDALGAIGAVTVSAAVHEPMPPLPVAVPVYVVVLSGATFVDPERNTYPIFEMCSVVASVDDQRSLVPEP